jgi:uncharacterized protein DUF1269
VDEQFPGWTLGGTALGSLIGALGGPVGLAIGMSAGSLAGLIGDLHTSGLDEDFLSEVSTALIAGKFAVVVDVDEEWVTPVDTRMEALGGVVFRTITSDVEDERRSREVAARRAELDQLKAEHAKARSDRKAKLQTQIDRVRERLEKRLEQNQARSKQAEEALQAKVQALQKKVAQEKGDAKAAIEARNRAKPTGPLRAPIRLPRAVPPRVQPGNCSSTRSLDTVPSALFLITASEFTSMLPSRSSADKACTPS